jgi:hypothetical protein
MMEMVQAVVQLYPGHDQKSLLRLWDASVSGVSAFRLDLLCCRFVVSEANA